MASVFIHSTNTTDTLFILTAEHPDYLVVTGADVVLKVSSWFHQLVSLQPRYFIVTLEVLLTEGSLTTQTGLDGLHLPPSTDITAHVFRSSIAVVRGSVSQSCSLEILHDIG